MRDEGWGMRDEGRKGSALLIVLGMIAIIVASAVAFSAYMRYARLPSSYLRRTSASRMLVKAALAEAIDIIDNSVGNDAYPGQKGREFVKSYRRITDSVTPDNVIDYWQDRCFIGSNRLVSVGDTVSTLCTEALAYIPPPIINEVRYYSRRSLAGMWHTLGFDSGRFAFAAVDVSDFFDVNSVCATPLDVNGEHMYGRNSSDSGRVTLAHVFENPQHTGYTYQPDDWDAFMDEYLDDGLLPLVSVADMNLAMNKQGLPAYMSPFCNYILNEENFVTSDSKSDPKVTLVRNMAFVTDSICSVTNRVPGRGLNLASASDQPFYGVGSISGQSQISAKNLLSGGGNAFTRYMESPRSNFNNDPEYVQLLDYLDCNSVPATLALPTVERTPMIVGVALEGEMGLQIEKGAEIMKEATEGATKVRYYATPYTLKLNGQLKVDAGTVYPFKHERGGEKTYKLEAAVTLAFVPECVPESEGLLRCNRAVAPAVITCNDNWSGVGASWTAPTLATDKKAVLQCRSSSVNVPYNKNPKTEQEAAGSADIEVSLPSFGGFALKSKLPANDFYEEMECTFRRCRKVKVVMVDGQETEVPDEAFVDSTAPGDRVGALPVAKDLSDAIAANTMVADATYIPTVQVWVRVFEGNDTVDLVPACWRDDKEPADILQDDARGSSQYPFLRFRLGNGVKFDFSKNGELTASSPGVTTFTPGAYLTDDPRFNYAPENFITLSGADAQGEFKDIWLNRQRSGDANRDGDIFMATSDAGYLQSVYELTHLVATTRGGDGFGLADGAGYNGKTRTAFADCPANEAMWRTYSQYDGGWAKDDIDRLDVINGARGFRVNPFTQSTDIMLAALANSPLDWWAASTNETVNSTVHGSAASAAKYSFSEMSGAQVKLKHANLESIAKKMIETFRSPDSNGNWRRAFDDLGWDGGTDESGGDTLCGVSLDGVKLHSVDRKYLHGFWKESLANRQQLFLIFVRAEPMMMGGGSLGQTPPQLGGRAVALVWRDPTVTTADVSGRNTSGGPRPHRSRILFYRQFD